MKERATVRFHSSRTGFSRHLVELHLLLTSLSPTPSQLWRDGAAVRPGNVSSDVTEEPELSFGHLVSGLPFDFAMRPGLLPRATPTAGRMLRQEPECWVVQRGMPLWQASAALPLESSELPLLEEGAAARVHLRRRVRV